ncbi:putative transcriptional regulator [Janibacter sp. HTCC2649]|uniref:MarR family winged helix-turn-helix transcriptional regulator n=1 Tax=Janibacter sp. HTCC2649 TaxID=313589 RepID=UPI000067093C|nr:MarR family transcriptional regulator [Janibacter sp. HTCC2649]EAQ00435.1 putative transcriptional regulator [Janibacter sp. HTCC2649]
MSGKDEPRWLDQTEMTAWLRLIAVAERLPGVLDSQLRRESALTHYEYQVLAMLSDAPDRTLRMTLLGFQTNATLPRLSHVVRRLEDRGFVERVVAPEDRRASNATLTDAGFDALEAAAPGHLNAVRESVFDNLTSTQTEALSDALAAILARIDPLGHAPQDPRDSPA